MNAAFADAIRDFEPGCEQERADRELMLRALEMSPGDILTRENPLFHMTASSIIVNRERTMTLMVWHNIYRSWAWTGGHADGDADLAAVARREACEETGIAALAPLMRGPASLEAIQVPAHVKRGRYVSAHLHLNLTYLFEADDAQPLSVKPDENSRVGWLPVARLDEFVAEKDMLPIYRKLLDRVPRVGGATNGRY